MNAVYKKSSKILKKVLEKIVSAKFKEDRKRVIFLLSSFGHTEIEYFGDRNDEVRPLFSKEVREVLLIQKSTNSKYMTYTGLILFLIIRTTCVRLLGH